MTSEEKQKLVDATAAFSRKNLESLVETHYKDNDWNAEIFEEGLSINNLLQIIPRIIEQVGVAVSGEDYSVYPNSYVSPTQGESQLIDEVADLIYCINKKSPLKNLLMQLSG